MKLIIFILPLLFISGCFFSDDENSKEKTPIELGEVRLNYYSNKSVTSLVVPPDLTKPDQEGAFKLSEFASGVQEDVINFSNDDDTIKEANSILRTPTNVEVKRSGERRWLIVDKNPNDVWDLSRTFLKQQGFAIQKANKKTGIIETDYLENRPDLPDQSIGIIRSVIRSATGQSYALPVIDKYRLRIEPTKNSNKTEVYLSLTSFHEVIYNQGKGIDEGENTIWQPIEKDKNLEAEMLYRLMVFLGGDVADSIQKIKNAKENNKISVRVADGFNGYAKLVFDSDIRETWDSVSWALDEKNINLEDKDIKEKAFYIVSTRTSDTGFFTKLFDEVAVQKKFQLQLKSIGNKKTEVYFNDISEENEQETKDYSYDLFRLIESVF